MKAPLVLVIKAAGVVRTVDAPVRAQGAGGASAIAEKVDAT